MFLPHVYVHSKLLANIGIFMGSISYNNCGFNIQKLTISRPKIKNPQTGIISGDSSIEPTRALFLESTRVLTVHLFSSALTFTVTTTQSNFPE